MDREAFVDRLRSETAAALTRAAGDPDALRGIVFLYLNRGYEAGLEPDYICELLGISDDNVLRRAELSKQDEAAVIDAYDRLSPVLEQQYKQAIYDPDSIKPE
jgi:hypothetical protein